MPELTPDSYHNISVIAECIMIAMLALVIFPGIAEVLSILVSRISDE